MLARAQVTFHLYLVAAQEAFRTDHEWLESVSRVAHSLPKVGQNSAAIQVRIKEPIASKALTLARAALGRIRDTSDPQPPLAFLNCPNVDAKRLGYDGVHWREDCIPRNPPDGATPNRLLAGASVHSIEGLRRAERAGAAFAVFGPIWSTTWKRSLPAGLKRLGAVVRAARLPIFAIGGIKPERVRRCLEQGAYGIAVVGSIFLAADPAAAIEQYAAELTRAERTFLQHRGI